MSFEDLPPHWPTMPLLDSELAPDVVDLFMGHRDRLSNSLALLLCDDAGRLVQPILISGMHWSCPEPQRRRPFDMLGDLLMEDPSLEIGGVLVAIGHRQPRVRTSDVDWARTARSRLDRIGLELFGCFVAHVRGVKEITDELGVRCADAS